MKQIPLLIALALSLSLCNLSERFGNKNSDANSNSASPTANSNGNAPGASTLPPADRPEPTAAQTAAIAGGQNMTWEQQGITWTLPSDWSKVNVDSKTLNWKSPGSFDAAFLIGSISTMGADFPTDISIKAMYDQAVTRQKNGEVIAVRWLELDGVRGVEFLETPPEGKEDPRRLEWQAYRKYAGQTQLITLILSSQGQHFERHKDALYGILYSTKIVHQ